MRFALITLFIFVALFTAILAKGQQGNNWYFGFNSGVTFNTNPPTGLSPSAIFTNEGSASVSDADGNLLFYTDGSVVYNKNHQLMPGGGLMGHFSSSQSAMIIQKPGSDSLYYIFTSPSIESNLNTGYYCAVVNMSLDGGRGAIIQNNFLYSPATEKLTASRHSDGIAVWAITLQNVSNRFKVFRIDCNGVNNIPVESVCGDIISGPGGYMKTSPDGSFLAVATTEYSVTNKFIRLYRFDNNTGEISQLLKIPLPTLSYGVEFSPDSRMLYVSSYPDADSIYQFNLNIYDSAVISSSKYVIATSFDVGGLQTGPDGKIYMSNARRFSLGEISLPNLSGSSCNYIDSSVTLSGEARGGLTNTMPNLIANLNATFNYSVHSDCSTVDFTGTTIIQGPVSWFWDFGDGNTSIQQNPTHTFPGSPNQFLVKLKVTVLSGCGYAKTSQTINLIRPSLQANFTSLVQCGILPVQFTSTSTISTGVINNWFWEFGDGNTSLQQNPLHTFPVFGSYNVKLTITYSSGCIVTNFITKSITIEPKPSPDFSNNIPCVYEPALFHDQSGSTSGPVTGWYWSFGDGATSAIQHPSHNYLSGGIYTIKMVAKSSTGCISDTLYRNIIINHKPVADFTIINPCITFPVQFTNTSTVTNATINQWFWNFGDANTSAMADPSHVFPSAGNYTIKFVATSDKGCISDTISRQIGIDAKPAAQFAINDGCVNRSLTTTNNSSISFGNIDNYYWDFANGNTSTQTQPTLMYSLPGNYQVKLVAKSKNGCVSDTATKNISIETTPTVDFSFGNACAGKDISFNNFTNNTYGAITGWNWSFGNSYTSSLRDPVYAYSRYGNYNITLTATTQNGCTASLSKPVIIRKTVINAGHDTTIALGQLLQLNATGALQYSWEPSTYLSSPGIGNPIATPSQDITYSLTGITAEGCSGNDIISIKVFNQSAIYVPTGFTPNGDGKNDILKPVIPGLVSLEYFNIYNRWGQIVFSTNEAGRGWDGKLNGIEQPVGVFVWMIKAINYKGEILSKKGTAMLIK